MTYRLTSLLWFVLAIACWTVCQVDPVRITGNGSSENVNFQADYGRPFVWLTRDWVANFSDTKANGPKIRIPNDARVTFQLLGFAENLVVLCIMTIFVLYWCRRRNGDGNDKGTRNDKETLKEGK